MGKLIKRSHVGLISILFLSMVISPSANAQEEQEWWFDVEFAIFKRNIDGSSVEDFSAATFNPSNDVGIDLFSLPILKQQTPYLSVLNALPDCEPTPMPEIIDMSATLAEISESPFAALNEFLSDEDLAENTSSLGGKQNENADEVLLNEFPALPTLQISQDHFAQLVWQGLLNQSITPSPEKVNIDDKNTSIFKNIELNANLSLNCTDKHLPNPINKVPTRLFSDTPYLARTNAILSENELRMATFIESAFKQRDITPLLYTAWRQQVVFGEDNARFVRIFAGDKLERNFDAPLDELMLNDNFKRSDDSMLAVLSSIEASIGSDKETTWDEVLKPKDSDLEDKQDFSAFEVEGLFKVYLDYVNRVPYLHIDSEFMHYRMALDVNGESKIEEFPFKQRRRIISKQIHYFDHPAIGILVRLHRYEPPIKNKVN